MDTTTLDYLRHSFSVYFVRFMPPKKAPLTRLRLKAYSLEPALPSPPSERDLGEGGVRGYPLPEFSDHQLNGVAPSWAC